MQDDLHPHGGVARTLRIVAPLSATYPLDRLVQVHPSLAARSLSMSVSSERTTRLQMWTGSKSAIDKLLLLLGESSLFLVQRSATHLVTVSTELTPAISIAAFVVSELGGDVAVIESITASGREWLLVLPPGSRAERIVARLRGTPGYSISMPHGMPVGARAGTASEPLLTPTERRVMREALRLGYYDQPKQVGVAKVAASLHLARSSAHYHLKRAERRLLAAGIDWFL